ncbi:MAG: hypothetical protein SGJ20_16990, partial [Planctomycetota bacterium]|nr:hypothetical protein [Planctomycetota bacterium]
FLDYYQQGKWNYYVASTLPAESAPEENELLNRLSHEFELCVKGLAEIRREWARREDGSSGGTVR